MYLVYINGQVQTVQTFREARKLCEHIQLENHINNWGYDALWFSNISNGRVFEDAGRWHYITKGKNYLNRQAIEAL